MYILFSDKKGNFYPVSQNQLDFDDYLRMEQAGHMVRIMEGARTEVYDYQYEHEPQLQEL